MKEKIRELLKATGAIAVGFAKAGSVDDAADSFFSDWIAAGNHAEMNYLERHLPLRRHTDSVLPGAKSVISLAFSYKPSKWRPHSLPMVAAYAYGEDYHNKIREILQPAVEELKSRYEGKWRICIDSAPVAERFWALKSGIGKLGLNGSVIVDGGGSLCFLSEILTDLTIEPDKASEEKCMQCGKCIKACPTKALKADGFIDSHQCINYLTIEKKGEFSPEEEKLVALDNGNLFGCDRCLRVCPHNKMDNEDNHSIFTPLKAIENLTPDTILALDAASFKKGFRNSPLLYAGFDKLTRNARTLKKNTVKR